MSNKCHIGPTEKVTMGMAMDSTLHWMYSRPNRVVKRMSSESWQSHVLEYMPHFDDREKLLDFCHGAVPTSQDALAAIFGPLMC